MPFFQRNSASIGTPQIAVLIFWPSAALIYFTPLSIAPLLALLSWDGHSSILIGTHTIHTALLTPHRLLVVLLQVYALLDHSQRSNNSLHPPCLLIFPVTAGIGIPQSQSMLLSLDCCRCIPFDNLHHPFWCSSTSMGTPPWGMGRLNPHLDLGARNITVRFDSPHCHHLLRTPPFHKGVLSF